MSTIERGRIKNGGIVFSKPLSFPEGIEVVVNIEPLVLDKSTNTDTSSIEDNFSSLSFFGMWADREEMNYSESWVRKKREQWQRRTTRKA